MSKVSFDYLLATEQDALGRRFGSRLVISVRTVTKTELAKRNAAPLAQAAVTGGVWALRVLRARSGRSI